jgi:uncharacterized protein (TIGR01619 family)
MAMPLPRYAAEASDANMTDNWKSYLCNVNGSLASVFVNLGLRDQVPVLSKPWLLWTWLYFQFPRPDGLSDGKEAPTLFEIEDALNSLVSRNCRAIPCGRITIQGRREFYFYAETKDGFREAVTGALAGFEEYKFDLGEQEDELWEQYLNVLYPSAEEVERIKNRELVDVLIEQGDVLTAARDVRHWIYFRSERSRSLFREAAVKAGFRIVWESRTEDDTPFGISIVRRQPVEQGLIDSTVIELVKLSKRFEGDYDGWETLVVTQ